MYRWIGSFVVIAMGVVVEERVFERGWDEDEDFVEDSVRERWIWRSEEPVRM